MTTLLSAQALQLETSHGLLFQNLNFTLQIGQRIGLIGHNGSGKSTLLSLLAGLRQASSGSIQMARLCRLQYVEQQLPEELHDLSLYDAMLAAMDDHADQPESHWRVDSLLHELDIDVTTASVAVKSLSGGQHTRLLLGRALLRDPNLLLLDEPSNHLDLPSLLWLEEFLLSWKGAFVLVSHDQRLLDRVTRQSWILRDRQITCFDQPCSAALRSLAAADLAAQARRNAEQDEIDRLTASSKRLAIWGRTYDNEDLARKAKTMQRRVDKLKDEQTTVTEGVPWTLQLHGKAAAANHLLQLAELEVSPAPGLPVLFRLEQLSIKSGSKIALLGANGTGKSSLLRLCWQTILSTETSAAIRWHAAAQIGYYDQSLQQLDSAASLPDALYPFVAGSDVARTELARKQALISAGFPYHRHQQTVGSLSGGERARLLFLALSMASYHLLFLDEPTNHLDMQGKKELTTALSGFAGGFLLVSHDRDLIEQSCNEFWVVQDGRMQRWLDAESAYQCLRQRPGQASIDHAQAPASNSLAPMQPAGLDAENLLLRLCELEDLLQADLARKARHQKPHQQTLWREEILRLNQLLEQR
ncbi:ATP-binding cassette domain-containing protein [Undibacterium sp. TS12]|uniref:ATP-binding cassette domain-containing protein n=1 Tax=Undibacterium sp. TS12 TaxID=2908202 RepID=UPI001F4C7AED|nr:ATP-binding cassette domain-containing protein [Undibacterium sp. TS12]MCH8622065.1 ATP-binding cassette domain-containing protein [Undibacterium sp. TS12]